MSDAAFTARSQTSDGSVEAAVVTVQDSDGNTTMFSLPGMVPGQVEQRCIQVQYDGPVDATLGMYVDHDGQDGLADALNVTVEADTTSDPALSSSGTFDCGTAQFVSADETSSTVTMADLITSSTDFSSALVPTSVAAGQVVVYRFTVEFDADVTDPNSYQGQSLSGLNFVWEIQT